MYSQDHEQAPARSARHEWNRQNNAGRWLMLKGAGYNTHRTLTLRNFDDLPPEVKIDLNYAASRPISDKEAANDDIADLRIISGHEHAAAIITECRQRNAILQFNFKEKKMVICNKLLYDFIPVFPQNGLRTEAATA